LLLNASSTHQRSPGSHHAVMTSKRQAVHSE
jgi:hypothetical protein